MSRPADFRDYDLSGDLHIYTLEVLAYNVERLIELDRERAGSRTAPATPSGATGYVQRAIMYLALLRSMLKDRSGKRASEIP